MDDAAVFKPNDRPIKTLAASNCVNMWYLSVWLAVADKHHEIEFNNNAAINIRFRPNLSSVTLLIKAPIGLHMRFIAAENANQKNL